MAPIANTIGEHYIQIGQARGFERGIILGQLKLLEAFFSEEKISRADYQERTGRLRQELEDLEKKQS